MTQDAELPSSDPIDDRPTIKLDQFLKVIGKTQTGGQAKVLIREGWVKVNGILETRRGRKLVEGDRVTIDDEHYRVTFDHGDEDANN
jgi:ribosome-associated protein